LNYYKDENYWSEFAPFAIAENQQMKTLIFPNPASAELNIQMEETVKSGVISLTVLDGKTLMKRPFSGNFVQISTENLPAGCYMIFVETGLGRSSQVVIVE
jgi:hypothetical protein